jgi:hypothetical protein
MLEPFALVEDCLLEFEWIKQAAVLAHLDDCKQVAYLGVQLF